MGIREDMEDLKIQIKKSIDTNNKTQVIKLLKQAFSLCETLKSTLETCTEEDRKDLAEALRDFRDVLGKESRRLSEKTGMSEEQLSRFNENPDNFSKEQWKAMQEIRMMFLKKTKEIKEVVKKNPKAKDLLGAEKPVGLKLSKSTKDKKKVPRAIKRSKWVKS